MPHFYQSVNEQLIYNMSVSKFTAYLRKLSEFEVSQLSKSTSQLILSKIFENATSNVIVAFFSNTNLVLKLIEQSVLNSLNLSSLIYASKHVDRLGYVVNRKRLFVELFKQQNQSLSARNFSVMYELCSTIEENRALYRNSSLISKMIQERVLSFNEFVEKLKHTNVFFDFVKSEVFDEYFSNNVISDEALTNMWNELFQTAAAKELSKFCSHRKMFSYVVKRKLVQFGNILKLKDISLIDKFIQRLQELKSDKMFTDRRTSITNREFFEVIEQIVQQCDIENNVRVFSGLQSSAEIREFISKKYEVDLVIKKKQVSVENEIATQDVSSYSNIDSLLQKENVVVSSDEIEFDDEDSQLRAEKFKPDLSQIHFSKTIEEDLQEGKKELQEHDQHDESFNINFLSQDEQVDVIPDHEFEEVIDRFFREAKENSL